MAPRTKIGAVLAVGIAFASVVAACGLDDTVDLLGGNGGGNGDATFSDVAFSDGAFSDGATGSGDGSTSSDASIDGDALIHESPDSADPDDADLSDATPADGGCANGSYLCTTAGAPVCLGDCVLCPGDHAACPTSNTCGASCTSCATSSTECYRSGFLGAQVESCVKNAGACAALTGSPLFCGRVPLTPFFIDCPGTDQVCLSNACLTCGEPSTKSNECSPASNGKCQDPGPSCQ